MKFADLHLHTIFSDGTYTPRELISESEKVGLSTIAVVDHDNVDAVETTIKEGESRNIEVLPGVELSAEKDNYEIHILGYLIDCKDERLKERLNFLRNNRRMRIYKMVDKLKENNIDLSPKTIFDLAGSGTVGRLHVARALLKEGRVRSIFEAFQKYIGNRCPAYVLGFKFTPSEAIKLIKDAGGIPVLAHPYSLANDNLIMSLIDSGIMGLEVYYPEHTQAMVNFYLSLAEKHNLLVTGGSDCHGNAKPEVKIGSVKIPYELIVQLKAAKEKLYG